VTDGFFRVLGVPPALGREFTADEDRVNGPPAAILSHALWTRAFGGDPGVIGRPMMLRGEPYTIVGVIPAGFRSNAVVDVWTPLRPSTKGDARTTPSSRACGPARDCAALPWVTSSFRRSQRNSRRCLEPRWPWTAAFFWSAARWRS
jgi:MacB-like protein